MLSTLAFMLVCSATVAEPVCISRKPCLLSARRRRHSHETQLTLQDTAPSAGAESEGDMAIPFDVIAAVAVLDPLLHFFLHASFDSPFALLLTFPRLIWSVIVAVAAPAGHVVSPEPWRAQMVAIFTAISAASDLLWWTPYYFIKGAMCAGETDEFLCRVLGISNHRHSLILFWLSLATGIFYIVTSILKAFQLMRDETPERRMQRSTSSALESGKSCCMLARLSTPRELYNPRKYYPSTMSDAKCSQHSLPCTRMADAMHSTCLRSPESHTITIAKKIAHACAQRRRLAQMSNSSRKATVMLW